MGSCAIGVRESMSRPVTTPRVPVGAPMMAVVSTSACRVVVGAPTSAGA